MTKFHLIEYRWADNQLNLVPELAPEFVRRQVVVIFALGGHAGALAAKVVTTTIRHVFDHAPAQRADGLVDHADAPV
jgi:hypothetical protein